MIPDAIDMASLSARGREWVRTALRGRALQESSNSIAQTRDNIAADGVRAGSRGRLKVMSVGPCGFLGVLMRSQIIVEARAEARTVKQVKAKAHSKV